MPNESCSYFAIELGLEAKMNSKETRLLFAAGKYDEKDMLLLLFLLSLLFLYYFLHSI